MKKVVLLAVVALLVATSPAYALFTNGGFETGNDSGWTITGDHSVIVSFIDQWNPAGLFSGIPYYGTYSLLLGSGDVGNVDVDGFHHSTATQTGTVTQADIDAGSHLYFKWGAILEEPTNGVFHSNADQPYFSATISKSTNGGSTWTQMYFADHRANQAGFTKIGTNATGDAGDIWYGTGTPDFDLTGLALNDQVKIDLFVQDCGLNGHGGLVFLDGFGTTRPDEGVVPEPASMSLLGLGLLGLARLRRKK